MGVEAELAREQVSERLLAEGGNAIEEVVGGLRTFLRPPDDLVAFKLHVGSSLAAIRGVDADAVTWGWQADEDWTRLWKEGLAPRCITPQLVVCPSWCSYDPRPGEHVIVLDPGMAFGTAEHGTTRGCLRLLDATVEPGQRLLDAGTGSGILAIAAAMLGAREVLGVESDESACPTAVENVEANGVQGVVRIETGIVSTAFLSDSNPWDGIVANIKTSVLTPLLTSLAGAIKPDGWVILSGILREEWATLVEDAKAAGLILQEDDPDEEWRSGLFRRQNALPRR